MAEAKWVISRAPWYETQPDYEVKNAETGAYDTTVQGVVATFPNKRAAQSRADQLNEGEGK